MLNYINGLILKITWIEFNFAMDNVPLLCLLELFPPAFVVELTSKLIEPVLVRELFWGAPEEAASVMKIFYVFNFALPPMFSVYSWILLIKLYDMLDGSSKPEKLKFPKAYRMGCFDKRQILRSGIFTRT